MRPKLKRTLVLSGVLLGVCAVAALVALGVLLSRPGLLRPLVLRALTPAGGRATVQSLSVSLRPAALSVEGLSVTGPRSDDDSYSIERLRAEVSLRRLLLGGGPWLTRLESKGLRFERRRPRTSGPLDLTPLTWLFRIGEASLTETRIRWATGAGLLEAEGVKLVLGPSGTGNRRFLGEAGVTFRRADGGAARARVTGNGFLHPGPALEAVLDLTGGRIDLPALSSGVAGRADLRLTKKELAGRRLELTLTDARLVGPAKTSRALGTVRLDAAAGATLQGEEPRLEVRLFEVPGVLRTWGRLTGRSIDALSGTFEGSIPDASKAAALGMGFVRSELRGTKVSGALPFRFRIGGKRESRSLGLEVFPRDLGVDLPDRALRLRLTGWLRLSGPEKAWSGGDAELAGELDAGGSWRVGPLDLRAFRLRSPVAGALRSPSLPAFRAAAAQGAILYGGRPLPLGPVDAAGSASLDARGTRLEKVEVRSEAVGRLSGSLVLGAGGPRGSWSGGGLRLPGALAVAAAVNGADWGTWISSGAADVAVRLEAVGGESTATVTCAVGGLGFTSPSGDVLGQNLGARLGASARLGKLTRFAVDLACDKGEALWGTAYADLGKGPLRLKVEGARAAPDRYPEVSVEGAVAGFGRLSLRGEASRTGREWRHRGRLVVTGADLRRLFATFVREPLSSSQPALAGLEAEGSAAVELAFTRAGERTDLSGTLSVRSGGLGRKGEPPVLSGLELELPVAYAFGKSSTWQAPPSPGAWGRLRLTRLEAGGQRLGPLDLPVALVPNRLLLGGGIDLPLFGGRLSFRKIAVEEPLSAAFRLDLAANLEGLDLGELPVRSALLQGRLGGTLDPVRVTRAELTSTGTLAGDLLGGRLEIRDPVVLRPLSPGREMGADLYLALLDLEKLSGALDLGRITGRVSGEATGLRVAYGQPVGMKLRLESVPTKGVRQLVSLKAVNSISLLGTGSALGGAGLSLMTRFFREFPYERIGFACELDNDVFTVRGLIREGGVEYLVKRPAFAGINVINQNPDNRISFSDMVDRLKRVTAKAASDGRK